jgi:phenylalanyl-tRNA synthetase beta chain
LKLSFDWLCDYSDFRSLPLSKVLEKINLSICEVDSVSDLHIELDKVIAVKITSIEKHSKSEKLWIANAFDGNETYTVITGAQNLESGDIVPLAVIGSCIGGKEIKKAVLQGAESTGMFCSEKELGISEDHSGIMKLPSSTKIGISLRKYLNLEDKIFLIDNKSITHRPDLWSHFGFARELAAQLNLPITFNPYHTEINFTSVNSIEVKKNEYAHSYFASAIKGISVVNSNDKIKSRLERCGIRSINNVVDVSNYIMLEMGQPTHFFDLTKLGTVAIDVNLGIKGTKIPLLDGTEKEVDESILLIKNSEKAVAVAGIMGGSETAVSDTTKELLLESAVFKREDIRRSIRKIGIRSEAAIRYEKGLNPNSSIPVIKRSIQLLKENGCPNLEASSPVGFILDSERKVTISTNFTFLEKKLGKRFPDSQILEPLNRLGFKTETKNDEINILIPEWRNSYDVLVPEDIVEEVGRSIGYAEIPVVPIKFAIVPAVLNDSRKLERLIKSELSLGFGFSEVYNYPFASQEDVLFENDKVESLAIKNAMPEEQRYLRTSPYPSIIRNLVTNADRYDSIKLFEFGRTYFPQENSLGREMKFISVASLSIKKNETSSDIENELLKIRRNFEQLFESLNIPDIELISVSKPYFHPNGAVSIYSNKTLVAELGVLHPALVKTYEIRKGIPIIGRIEFDSILPLFTANKNRFIFKAPSHFPQDSLDISLLLSDSEGTERYAKLVRDLKIEELSNIHVDGIFKGGNVPEGKKSVTYRISLVTYKETFTQNKINSIMNDLLALAKKEGFQLR